MITVIPQRTAEVEPRELPKGAERSCNGTLRVREGVPVQITQAELVALKRKTGVAIPASTPMWKGERAEVKLPPARGRRRVQAAAAEPPAAEPPAAEPQGSPADDQHGHSHEGGAPAAKGPGKG